eukprot:COSAG06_NODE_427_length_15900_cov_371.736519_11_plen_65_part_00
MPKKTTRRRACEGARPVSAPRARARLQLRRRLAACCCVLLRAAQHRRPGARSSIGAAQHPSGCA